MPVVVKSLSGNRQDRCRARPQVIVDVLGWFVGSFWADGTTGFVANELGRRFILVDQNPESIQVIKDRIPNGSFHFVD
jgi:hypothetical protein